MDHKIFTSKVFTRNANREYKGLKGKELKPDNKSWFNRIPNSSYYPQKNTKIEKPKRGNKKDHEEKKERSSKSYKSDENTKVEIEEEEKKQVSVVKKTELTKTPAPAPKNVPKVVTFLLAMTIPGSGKTTLKQNISKCW